MRLVAAAERLRREYVVGAGRPIRMVVLGDSTAAGVGAGSLEGTLGVRVAASLGGRVEVTNLAVSGATLADVVRHQLPALPPGSDLALVSISANDATHGTPPDAFGRDLERLLEGLRRMPRVVLTTTPNFRTTPALPWVLNRLFERRAATLTRAIRQAASRRTTVRLADLNREGTLGADEYAADGFHPNAAGYAAWAAVLARAASTSDRR